MRKERGGVILFLLFILLMAGLIVGGFLFMKNRSLLNFRLPFSSGSQGNRNLIDVTQPPAQPYLSDYARHCNETPNYHWNGSSCTHN